MRSQAIPFFDASSNCTCFHMRAAPFSCLSSRYHNQIDGWLSAAVLFRLSPTLSLQDICSITQTNRCNRCISRWERFHLKEPCGRLELQNSTFNNNNNTWLKEMEMIYLEYLKVYPLLSLLEKKEKSVQGIRECFVLLSPELISILFLFALLPYFMCIIAFHQG